MFVMPSSLLCFLRQRHPIHDGPFLGVRDPCGVEPVGEPVGGSRGVMPDEGGGEVLRDAGTLALGDEPLPGGVEHGASEGWMLSPDPCVGFDDPVDREMREEAPLWGEVLIQHAL